MRRLTTVLALVLAASALGCGDAASIEPPPEIEDAAMEPQVAAKLRAAREAVVASPESASVWGRLGMIFDAHRLLAEAEACYRQATLLAPADYRWPYLAAQTLVRRQPEESLTLFRQAADLSPANAAVFINYGNALLSLGRAREATVELERALEIDPTSAHALFALARAAHGDGDLEQAQRRLERAVTIEPRLGEAHGLLAQVYGLQGETELAARELRVAAAYPEPSRADDPVTAAMESEAATARSHTQRGLRLARSGRYAEAEAQFRRVLEIRPGGTRDFTNLGGALAGQGRSEEAMAEFERALRLDPEDPYAHNNLGSALLRADRLEEAAAALGEAVRIDPAYADAHHNLGLVRQQQGRPEAAIDHLDRALELDPGRLAAYSDLGTTLAAAGRLEEAMERWRSALEISPNELSPLYNLSVALAGRGEHAEAVMLLRRGLAKAPNSSRLLSLLAWELATVSDPGVRAPGEALRHARRIAQAYPDDAQVLDVLAAALAADGRFDEAVENAARAAGLAARGGQTDLQRQIQARLAIYRDGRPFRQP